MQLGIPLSSFYKLFFFTTTHNSRKKPGHKGSVVPLPVKAVGKKSTKKVTIGPFSVKELECEPRWQRTFSSGQRPSQPMGLSHPHSVGPLAACEATSCQGLTDKERDLFETFLILKEEDQLELASLLRLKCGPKAKLFFVESVIEKKYPWIQRHLEIFWDYAKLHKYVYNENNKCENIFGKTGQTLKDFGHTRPPTQEKIRHLIFRERSIYEQLEGF